MSVRDISTHQLHDKRSELEQQRIRLQTEAAKLKQEIAARNKRVEEISELDRRLYARNVLLLEADFICGCIPETVAELRHEMRCLATKIADEQITVAEQRRLVAELAQKRKDMQSTCPHPLVIFNNGYRGSSSDDYDDAYHGTKSCVVCGCVANDTDYEGRSDVFPDNGRRLFNPLIDEFANYSDYRKTKLRDRLADYDALASTDEIIDQFFGPKRLERLKRLLEE